MEPFIADFIRDSEIPKGIRFGIASLLCGLIIAVCLLVSFKSPFIWGRIFGGLSAIAFVAVYISLAVMIYEK